MIGVERRVGNACRLPAAQTGRNRGSEMTVYGKAQLDEFRVGSNGLVET
jgi:hypothetical protein